MGTESAPEERIEELESTVERLRERVEAQQEILSLLAAHHDSDALPKMGCPYCDSGTLYTDSGMTWQRVECDTCDLREYV